MINNPEVFVGGHRLGSHCISLIHVLFKDKSLYQALHIRLSDLLVNINTSLSSPLVTLCDSALNVQYFTRVKASVTDKEVFSE